MRTQYQVQNETQNRKNQKFNKNDNNEIKVKNYPKNKQPITHQQKFKPPNCPCCKRKSWLELDKGWYCQNCEYIINKQKHQIDKKSLRQDNYFSARLPYANKKIIEIWMNMANTTYNSTEDLVSKLQELKGKTIKEVYENISKYYDEIKIRNFLFGQDPFDKIAQGISKIYQESLLLLKFLTD